MKLSYDKLQKMVAPLGGGYLEIGIGFFSVDGSPLTHPNPALSEGYLIVAEDAYSYKVLHILGSNVAEVEVE